MNTAIYLTIIIIYFIVMILIGVLSRKMTKTSDGFFVAGRSGSTLLITGSLVATIIGGSATIGLAGLGYNRGLSGMWWLLVGSIGLFILGFFLAKKIRQTGVYTLPGLLGKQYSGTVSLVTSILISVAWLGVIAGQIIATGKIMSVLGLGSPVLWMIIFSVVFISYTLIGGQYADIRTDLIQAVIIFAGIFAGFILIMIKIGGWSTLVSSLPADRFSFPLSANFKIVDLISYLLLIGLTYVIGPDMCSRILCAKDPKVARKSVLLTALFIIPFAIVITLIGMAAWYLFHNTQGFIPEQAFPYLIKNQLPPIAGGLIIAALLSATMSSADSCLMSVSTILSVDVMKKIKPSMKEKQTILVARISILV
ncbi:MAG: sodium:solute symporter family protein, partial [Chloroflexi bacterium]|nr:sodium:solute symporter family protein [Chloroflexota bacterium]